MSSECFSCSDHPFMSLYEESQLNEIVLVQISNAWTLNPKAKSFNHFCSIILNESYNHINIQSYPWMIT